MAFRKFIKQFIAQDDLDDSTGLLRIINSLQNNIESSIQSLIEKSQNDSQVLTNIRLEAGNNVINHKLNKKLSGWKVVRKRSAANIYDDQDNNNSPQLTLILVSDAAVTIDLEVF